MSVADQNEDQRRFWSEEAGDSWVRRREVMDATLAPVLNGVLTRAAPAPGHSALDIGCGAGTSTRAVAARITPGGHVTGIDISEPLLAYARAHNAENATYLNADAQIHPFAPDSADLIVSRFGVMFFADTAAAFANLARALKPGGRMVLATWGAIPENPFFTLPARVARERLGPVPKSDPDAPGPFALRDADLVLDLLGGAGLRADVETLNEALPLGTDARAAAETFREIGPIAGAFRHHDADPDQRRTVIDALVAALEEHRRGDGIFLPSQVHYFTATKPS